MNTPSLDLPVRSLLVLVAEDDDDQRALLVEALERDGHRAVELEDGFEFGDYVQVSRNSLTGRTRPDLIVTDWRMPGHDGLEIARRAREAGLGCPIIVISAFTDPAIRRAADALGGATFLAKPIDVEEISALVARVARA